MRQVQVYLPAEVNNAQSPAPLGAYDLQFLAQGDSWFSVGAMPPLTTNLFDGMGLSEISACVVNCAQSGAKLSRMADTTIDRQFMRFLAGPMSTRWAGLLLLGGGNDLIEAAQLPPTNRTDMRLFATPAEWTSAPAGERYLSNAGWQTFCTHIAAVFANLVTARDSGQNHGIPIIWHTYDIAVARDAGAGLGFGPWLYPAMLAYQVPQSDWAAVSVALLDRLETLIDHLSANTADGSVHVVHGQGTLTQALPTDRAATEDWQNEIHPTPAGYRKLSALWRPVLDAVFAGTVTVPSTPEVSTPK